MPSILTIVDLYRDRLKVYGHLGLPRFHTSNSFQDRIDTSLITLVRECPNLNTLVNSFRVLIIYYYRIAWSAVIV